jgi:hypothetical protein
MEHSGLFGSVRDYHSLNSLGHQGFSRFSMTGCPALYSLEHLGKPARGPVNVNSVTYSLGVGFVICVFFAQAFAIRRVAQRGRHCL